MKLLLPEIVKVMIDEKLDLPFTPADLLRAERYVFESYGDIDEDTVKAVFDTSHEMIEYGFFHLPHPLMWLEDPWPEDWIERSAAMVGATDEERRRMGSPARGRNLYLLRERADGIEFYEIVAAPLKDGPQKYRFIFHAIPHVISLDPARNPIDFKGDVGTARIAIKQFVVTLETEQAVRERRISDGYGGSVPKAHRNLGYTDVRVVIPGERGDGQGGHGDGGKRRRHLVAGYNWGKHTRPRPEQKWIKPFWRGDKELGFVPPKLHTEVRHRG